MFFSYDSKFSQLMIKLCYSCYLNLLWFVCSIPIFTIGASTTALDRFCENTALYSCNAKRFKRIVNSVEARNIPPAAIGQKVVRILEKRNPKFAYAINRNPLLLMLNILPARVQFWVIKLVLK